MARVHCRWHHKVDRCTTYRLKWMLQPQMQTDLGVFVVDLSTLGDVAIDFRIFVRWRTTCGKDSNLTKFPHVSLFGSSILRRKVIAYEKLCRNYSVFIYSRVKFSAQIFFTYMSVWRDPEVLTGRGTFFIVWDTSWPPTVNASSNPKDGTNQNTHTSFITIF